MIKWKSVALPVAVLPLFSILAACGGDTSTPTAVLPTATTAATSTPATNTVAPQPSNTPIPPTVTVALPATQPPATQPAATQPPTAPSSGTATSSDATLVKEALAAGKDLKSYHFTMAASGDAMSQSIQVAGDFVAPDKVYIKGTVNGAQTEQLATGGQAFSRVAGGAWTQTPAQAADPGTGPTVLNVGKDPNPLTGLDALVGGAIAYKAVGDEALEGVPTRHFSGKVDAAALMGGGSGAAVPESNPALGTADFWIDPATKQIHRVRLDLDLAPFFKLLDAMMGGMMGTPGAGTPSPTPLPASMKMLVEMNLSRHNDATIHVPDAPAGAQPAPTATAVSNSTGDPAPSGTVTLGANAGHNTPDKALAVSGPVKAAVTLGSAQDVVYLRFKAAEHFTLNLSVINPDDGGVLNVSLIDAAGKSLLDPKPIEPGVQYSLGQGPFDAGTYLLKIAADSGATVSKKAIKVEINGPSEQIQPTETPEAVATDTPAATSGPATTIAANAGHSTPAQALAVTLPLHAQIHLAGPDDVLYLSFTLTEAGSPTAAVRVNNPNKKGSMLVMLTDKTGAEQSKLPAIADLDLKTMLILKGAGKGMGTAGTYYLKISAKDGLNAASEPVELELAVK